MPIAKLKYEKRKDPLIIIIISIVISSILMIYPLAVIIITRCIIILLTPPLILGKNIGGKRQASILTAMYQVHLHATCPILGRLRFIMVKMKLLMVQLPMVLN